ncbi:MAG: hypothetical protein CUN55_03965 [Phototrophicales bacterium]|nr:MAG: hypothetical protein CUN55_03965 [Phototrophicales bacterium]
MTDDNRPKRTLYDYDAEQPTRHWYGSTTPRSIFDDEEPSHKPEPSKVAITSPSAARKRALRRRAQRADNLAILIIVGALIGMTAIVAMLVFFVANDDGSQGTSSRVAAAGIEPTSVIYGEEGAMLDNSLVIEPWQGNERFTLLLMGTDTRPDESDQLCRTDTIIVVSIDPRTRQIGMLSIPRDTYVEIPNHGLDRINRACVIGNLESVGRGPYLAMQTIQYNFGIKVNDYVIVNFDAFRNIIDRIGGVNVYVEQTIDDPQYPDEYYGYDPFYIEAGWHLMDGETALKYARSRYSSDDIDRGHRQQQIILAIRERVLSLGMLDDLATQAIPLWNDINDGVQTGLSLEQMVQLALYAAEIDFSNIKTAVLDWEYLRPYRLEDGQDILIPDRAKLPTLMLEVFGEGYAE